jgi:hypothetical protein
MVLMPHVRGSNIFCGMQSYGVLYSKNGREKTVFSGQERKKPHGIGCVSVLAI